MRTVVKSNKVNEIEGMHIYSKVVIYMKSSIHHILCSRTGIDSL